MAIFIIDQFSLNTDLPLDIRYVPTGGTYFDVSAYWYPGMQVYQTSDETIWYADNSLNWHNLGSAGDASINQIWNYIIDLSTSISDLDASVNQLFGLIPDVSGLASIIYVDGSLNARDVSIARNAALINIHEASLGNLTIWNNTQDASIIQLISDISTLNYTQGLQDTSIGFLDSSVNQLFGLIPDVSGLASILYVDGSLNARDVSIARNAALINIHESSLGNLTTITNFHESSLGNLTQITNLHETSLGNLTQITNDLDTSLDLFVLKAGDTMTGPLTITGGGLQVGSIGSPQDVSIYSDLYVHNDAFVGGNLHVDGSLFVTSVETIDVSAGFIHLNTGLTGTPPASMQSGIVIGRGSLEPYVFIFDESTQDFRIGIAFETSTGYIDSSTQAVATREDTPTIDGVAVWNASENRFDTYTGLTYDKNTLRVDPSLNLPSIAGGSNLMLVVQPSGNVIALAIPDVSGLATISYIDGSLNARDISIANNASSITTINLYQISQDASIVALRLTDISQDASIVSINLYQASQDASITALRLTDIAQDASIVRIDGSINYIFDNLGTDTSVLGAINIGDSSGQVFAGITNDGSLQFKGFVGANGVLVSQTSDLISIQVDPSFSGGEVNTASNIGTGEGLAVAKEGVDLPFKSLAATNPSELIITSDASTIYFDVSISSLSDASLWGLTDVAITPPLDAHQIIEWDSDVSKWVNTNNIWWDTSLGTTTDDLGGVPQGTVLEGLTLKEVLYKILYEYQIPTLVTGSNPAAGTYEKGLVSTQFASIDVSYYATNANYPLALLNNVQITKTGAGVLLDASLGLVASDSSIYTDGIGITNWGGTNRTISYNITIDDNQASETQPAVGSSKSFTFYYRQYWGEVDGLTIPGTVNSTLIHAVDSSRLAGETDLIGTFTYVSGAKIKFLFAYPDTVAAPDNFGILSQILDQNDFDITGSWDTGQVDVSVGVNNIRYRYYLLKNKVDTPTFNVTFKF